LRDRAAKTRVVVVAIDAPEEDRSPVDGDGSILELYLAEANFVAGGLKDLIIMAWVGETDVDMVEGGSFCGPFGWV